MLNSLVIKNFRALEDFSVEKLGRVNLIVGKNNSGKSTVLEALRIYAGNALREQLVDIAESHDETYQYIDSNSPMPFEDLFTGRHFPEDEMEIVIGELLDSDSALHIGYRISIVRNEQIVEKGTGEVFTKLQYKAKLKEQGADIERLSETREILLVTKNRLHIPHYLRGDIPNLRANLLLIANIDFITCSFIPTQLISMDDIAEDWDKIVGTEHEDVVKDAISMILPEFENIYFVQNNKSSLAMRGSQRTAKVKLKLPNLRRPVPLKSLGDGMIRILQLALKLVSAKGGFLLIDEFENGLHYSVQEKVWSLLFEMAERLDIQIFATTHSWDCVQSFATVALQKPEDQGVLFRMGNSVRTNDYDKIIATVFSGEDLTGITQADMEVR